MPDPYRVMVRLSPELYGQLTARAATEQPLAAIIRQALVEYLARPPEQPRAATEQPAAPEGLAARLTTLETQVEALTRRVEALAAHQQPGAADTSQEAATEQSEQPMSSHEQPVHHGRPGLAPATLQAIADARTQYPDLTMKAFAQQLFEQGIYRGRARDGREVPADHSRLRRWLRQAQRQDPS